MHEVVQLKRMYSNLNYILFGLGVHSLQGVVVGARWRVRSKERGVGARGWVGEVGGDGRGGSGGVLTNISFAHLRIEFEFRCISNYTCE